MITEPNRRWRRILVWGTAWGIAITVVEQLEFTPGPAWTTVNMLLWWLTDWLTPLWCLVGCLFVWVADRAPRQHNIRDSLLGWLTVALTSAIAQPFLENRLQAWIGKVLPAAAGLTMRAAVRMPPRPLTMSLTVYNLWINLFYGGLLMMAYSLTLRRERTRSLLHENAVARNRTQAILDEARLQALQRQMDPALLLSSMGELEKRYRNEPAGAERLLETLVDFLRCAMPGLREPVSTVDTELRLARAYVRLQNERGPRSGWSIEELQSGPLHAKFPSLLMLPLLAMGEEGSNSHLTTRCANGQVTLTASGLREASLDFVQSLRARLQSLYGGACAVKHDPSTRTVLEITLNAELPTRSVL
jgi:Histidine kinase